MRYLPSDEGFLGIPAEDALPPERCRAVVIPFGLEASVSYGGGTAQGPAAMIAASHEVELYDDRLGREAAVEYGVCTLEADEIPDGDVAAALEVLASKVEAVYASGRFPIVFGGEHSITPGAIRPAVARWPELGLLHFDAHADLRDGYHGEHFSHAAAIRRCLDNPGVSTVSIGIRNISATEIPFLDANRHRVHIHWGRDRRRYDADNIVAPLIGKKVWLTFDVDGLDASLMPATGTPEPGGLFWDDVMDVFDAARRAGLDIVGADVNELAPIDGWHASDFVAAKLAYQILNLALVRD